MDLTKILNAFFTGLNAHLDRGFASVVKALSNTKDVGNAISEQTNALRVIFSKFDKSLSRIENPKIDVTVDMAEVQKRVYDIYNLMQKQKEYNLMPIYDELKSLRLIAEKNVPEKLGEKFDALDAVFKGLKPKDSVKFDDKQMTSLMAALTNGGRGGFNTAGGIKSATDWDVVRVALTDANTQYSYTFPANTVSWTMKLRAQGATLFYASETGKLPVSGDNTTYMTMLPMGARSQDGMEWGGKTMYFESDTATQVVEIEVFTM